MKSRTPEAPGPSPAFVLLDTRREPIFANAEAHRILTQKRPPASAGIVPHTLSEALSLALPSGELPGDGASLSILSGRRRYSCRVFRLAPLEQGDAAFLLMIDRSAPAGDGIHSAVERYSLTHREAELLRHLMTGLTNKEIGERMQISPNTVKAFLKLMMTKMGVTTRAAVVGRAFESQPQAMSHTAGL